MHTLWTLALFLFYQNISKIKFKRKKRKNNMIQQAVRNCENLIKCVLSRAKRREHANKKGKEKKQK